jgi:hypothetical protein
MRSHARCPQQADELRSKLIVNLKNTAIYFGHARNKRVATLHTLFGALCLGAGLFFGIAGGQTFGWIIGLIPLTFSGGFGILLLALALWLWLGTTTVEVLNRELHIRSTCLGLSRSRVISASTIQDFSTRF